MNLLKNFIAAVTLSLLVIGMSACQKEEEGPAEKAGKEVDETLKKAGEKMDNLLGKEND